MPTYEYTCKRCGDTIEVFQSFSEKPLRKHDADCGGDLQKIFHARGVVFKGSGFYSTDSRPTPSTSKSKETPSKLKETPTSTSPSSTSSSTSTSSSSSSSSSSD